MTSHDRVLTACRFERPDRIPRFDICWEYPENWRARLGDPENLTDISIWCPNEGTYPTRARLVRETDHEIIRIDQWGRTLRTVKGTYFYEVLETPVPPGTDVDTVVFDPPDLDMRFLQGEQSEPDTLARLDRDKTRHCVFTKTGGPYLRTTFVRGETQFLTDIATDPPLARALADKMAAHLTAVALEGLRRWDTRSSGVWIYDDMAYNDGPMFSPRSFERVFLPGYRSMINAFKNAGATYVMLHSDGDIRPLLDMLIDAGIDGIHPLERRAGMDPATLRAAYPRLILAGGMDNSGTLIDGPAERIETDARELIELGRNGGLIIGTHSISPEIPLENFCVYDRVCRDDGRW